MRQSEHARFLAFQPSQIVTQDLRKYNRRDVLSATCATVLLSGCGGKNGEPVAQSQTVSDVPLRVLWVGQESDVEAVTRAWGSVMSQPLKIEVLPMDRANPTGLMDGIVSRVKKNDLLVVPTMAITGLIGTSSIIPLNKDEVQATADTLGRLFPAVRNGATMLDGKTLATPIGARLPALLSVNEVGSLESWQDYHQWVQKDLDGAAAEPLADGWAGMMYLWRAASSVKETWLFDAGKIRPVISTQPYVEVLEQMVSTAKLYGGKRNSPQQIWSQLKAGKLSGGVGFPIAGVEGDADVSFSDLPRGEIQNRVVMDCYSPVAAISAGCRQSDAAKQLMTWLSGGDGSEAMRRQIGELTVTRSAMGSNTDSRKQSSNGYDQWLANRLSNSSQLSTLNIQAADQYYSVLDQQVGECLDGKVEPIAAMENVAQKWAKLSAELARA